MRINNGVVKPYILRMEAKELARREKLERERGRKAYDSNQNKKQCPKCYSFQTWDEVVEKRKKCVNCGIEYRPLRTWAHVEKEFTIRMEDQSRKKTVYI